MMAADYTQWHGIWDLQKDLVEIIRYAADHGLPEAETWMESDNPAKFWLYPFYDIPGSPWGIDTLAFRKSDEHTTKVLMNRDALPDYWERVRANVEAAWMNGVLSDEQWEMWQKLYDNRDRENGQIFALSPDVQTHKDGGKVDGTAVKAQVTEFKLPFGGAWEWIKTQAKGGQ